MLPIFWMFIKSKWAHIKPMVLIKHVQQTDQTEPVNYICTNTEFKMCFHICIAASQLMHISFLCTRCIRIFTVYWNKVVLSLIFRLAYNQLVISCILVSKHKILETPHLDWHKKLIACQMWLLPAPKIVPSVGEPVSFFKKGIPDPELQQIKPYFSFHNKNNVQHSCSSLCNWPAGHVISLSRWYNGPDLPPLLKIYLLKSTEMIALIEFFFKYLLSLKLAAVPGSDKETEIVVM